MLYDKYKRKIVSFGQVLKVVVKFLPLIIIVTSVIVAATAALLATKGTVSDIEIRGELSEGGVPTVEYGEIIPYHANAFLSEASYEYRKAGAVGEEAWSTQSPREPGEYEMRAVGNASFGGKRYSNTIKFKIAPRHLIVRVVETDITYGNMPEISASLLEGDHIECTSFTVDYSLDENGIREWIDEDGSVRVSADVAPVQGEIKIYDVNDKDVTSFYAIEVEATSIHVLKRPISIPIDDSTKTYDGIAVTDVTYDKDSVDLAVGDNLKLIIDDPVSNHGSVELAPTFTITAEGGEDMTDCYEINLIKGQLTIDKRPLTVTLEENVTAVYSGKEIRNDKYDLTSSPLPLAEGHTIELKEGIVFPTEASDTPYNNPIDFVIKDKDGNDVTDNYSIATNVSTITVTKRPITVETDSLSKTYDGSALTASATGFKLTLGELAEGQAASTSGTMASVTDAQSVSNAFALTILDKDGKDRTANYEITYNYGTLEILPLEVIVKPVDVTFVYDALPHTANEIELVGDSKPLLGHELVREAEMPTSLTNAGEISHNVSEDVVKIMHGDKDVTSNYKINTETEGKITVTQRPIYVEPLENQEKSFDGLTFVSDKINDEVYKVLVDGHTLTVKPFESSGTSYGIYNWTIKVGDVTIMCGADDVTANYKITAKAEPTEMVISKNSVYIKPVDVTFVYDGQPHAATEIEFAEMSAELSEKGFTVTYEGMNIVSSGSDVADYDAEIPESEKGNIRVFYGGEDVTDNYNVNITALGTTGKISITKRPITITPVLSDKIYDGENLTSSETKDTTNGDGGLLSGHTIKASYNSANTNAGSYTWTLSADDIDIMSSDKSVKSNYDISLGEPAQANITPRKVYVIPTVTTSSKIYDNMYFYADGIEALTNEKTAEIADDGLIGAHSLRLLGQGRASIHTSDANVGEGKLLNFFTSQSVKGIEDILSFEDGADKNNYEVIFKGVGSTNGGVIGTEKVSITKRPIEITPVLNDKIYDGENLTSSETKDTTNGDGGLLSGHTIKASYNSANTNAGSYTWTLSAGDINIMSGNIPVTDNYEISLGEPAQAEITPRKVYVIATVDSASKIYDDKYFFADGIEALSSVDNDGLVQDQSLSLANRQHIRTESVNVENNLPLKLQVEDIESILSFESGAKKENYEVIFRDTTTVSITERTVYVIPDVSENTQKIYDNDKFYAEKIKEYASGEVNTGLVSGHEIKLNGNNYIRTEGVDAANSLYLYLYGADIEDIVTFTSNDGQLKKNYNIVYCDDIVTVDILKRPVTISAELIDKTYDGDELQATAQDVSNTANSGLLTSAEHNVVLDHSISVNIGTGNTFAGNYDWNFTNGSRDAKLNGKKITNSISILCDTTDVTHNYELKFSSGTVSATISMRPVRLTPHLTHNDVYDGNDVEYYFTSNLGGAKNQWILGSSNTFTVSASSFGSHQNVGTYKWELLNYSGTPTSRLTYNSSTQTDGEIKITLSGKDVTSNFEITYGTPSTLNIAPRKLYVAAVADPDKKDYDGDYFYATGIEALSGIYANDGLVSTHTVSLTSGKEKYIRTETADAGENYNLKFYTTLPSGTGAISSIEDIITFSGGANKANYDVHFLEQTTVTINPRTVYIAPTVNGATYKTYDDKYFYAHAIHEVKHSGNTGLLDGHSISFNSASGFTIHSTSLNAGTWELRFYKGSTKYSFNESLNNAVTISGGDIKNYNVIYASTDAVDIDIKQRNVTIIPIVSSNSKVYDAKPFHASGVAEYIGGYTKADEGLLTGHALSYNVSSIGIRTESTNVGNDLVLSSYTEGCVSVSSSTGDVTKNYNITYNSTESFSSGKVTVSITARPITVIPYVNDPIKTYDGEVFCADGVSLYMGSLADSSHKIEYTSKSIHTADANVGNNKLLNADVADNAIKIMSGSSNVTANYVISYENAYVSITEKQLNFTIKDDTAYYDGHTYHTLRTDNIELEGQLDGHAVNIEDIKLKYTDIYGTVTYNGYLGISTDNATASVTAHTYSIIITDSKGEDVSNNYDIAFNNATLLIALRQVNFTPYISSTSKIYDGTVMEISEATARVDVDGNYTVEVLNPIFTDSADARSYSVTFKKGDVKIYEDGIDITDICHLVFEPLSVEILQRTITIETGSSSHEYDGNEYFDHTFTHVDGTLVGNDKIDDIFNIEYTGHVTNVSEREVDNTAKVTVLNPNYKVIVQYGKLSITPFNINVVIKGRYIAYTGRYLTADDVDWNVDPLWSGGEFKLIRVLLKNVDDKFNGKESIEYTVMHENEIVDPSNYTVTASIDGSIVIGKIDISVKSDSLRENYEEGTIYSCNTAQVNNGTLPEGHTITWVIETCTEGNPEETVRIENILESVTVWCNGEDVTRNFNIEKLNGWITVIKPKQ